MGKKTPGEVRQAGLPDSVGRGSRLVKKPGGFFARVYALVATIPRGKVATYGQIARMLGVPRAARTVGWAMHGNPHGTRIPCHRVVQQGGSCSPNFSIGDPGAQRRRLLREGVRFLLDGRVDMQVHQWRPRLPAAPRPRT
jgi:methylated-DNA-protein-cysteine methyltransferase-like protein